MMRCLLLLLGLAAAACVSSQAERAKNIQWRDLAETPGCQKTAVRAVGRVSILDDPDLGQLTLLPLFSAAERCLRVDDELNVDHVGYSFRLAEDGLENSFASGSREYAAQLAVSGGRLRVTGVTRLDDMAVSESPRELAESLGVSLQQVEKALALIRLDKQKPPVFLVKATIIGKSLPLVSRIRPFVPELMNGIILPDRAPRPPWAHDKSLRLSSWQVAGSILYDVRSRAEFNAGHAPGAVHLPYRVGRTPRWWEVLGFLPQIEDEFDVGSLPTDKMVRIAFTGQSLQDPRPVRAQLRARLAGWKNAAFVYGGERARNGLDYATPTDAPGICELSDEEVVRLKEGSGASFVDVRSRAEFLEKSIPGAVHLNDGIEFDQLADRFSGLRFDPTHEWLDSLSLRLRAASGPLRSSPQKIIFFGNDAFDPRPLWAVTAAFHFNSKQVCWWRGGLVSWLNTKNFSDKLTPQRSAMAGPLIIDQAVYAEQLRARRPDLWASACQENLLVRSSRRRQLLDGGESYARLVQSASQTQRDDDDRWVGSVKEVLAALAKESSAAGVQHLRFPGDTFHGLQFGKTIRCSSRYKGFLEIAEDQLGRIPMDIKRLLQELLAHGYSGDFKIPLHPGQSRWQHHNLIFHSCDPGMISLVEKVGLKVFGSDLVAVSRGLDIRLKNGRTPSWNELLCEGRFKELTVEEMRFVRYFW